MKSDENTEIINSQCNWTSKQPPPYYGYNEAENNFYHVSFCRENIAACKGILALELDRNNWKYYGVGWLHLDMPYSDNAHLIVPKI